MRLSSSGNRVGRSAGRMAAQGLVILLLGIAGTVCVLEVWLRLQPRRSFLVFDEVLGFRLQPGATGVYRGRWMLAANPHIHTPIRINALGMRGPDRSLAKAPGTRRLMILGDSFVQAFEVPWADTFYARLEQRARERGGRLETFPMGVSGYGQAQQLLWLDRLGSRAEPDVVLLVVFLANDVTDNSSDIGAGTARPYFELRGGDLVQVSAPSTAARWKYAVSEHIRSFILYREIVGRISALRGIARTMGWVNYPEGQVQGGGEFDSRRRAAWQLTFALIREIATRAREYGAETILAFHGSYPTGSSEPSSELMLRFCRDAELECLDLSPILDGGEHYFVPDDRHWTAAAHERIADLLWSRWSRELLETPAEGRQSSVVGGSP